MSGKVCPTVKSFYFYLVNNYVVYCAIVLWLLMLDKYVHCEVVLFIRYGYVVYIAVIMLWL